MTTFIRRHVCAAAVIGAVLVPGFAFAQTPPVSDIPTIVTRGSGSIKRAPDQAWVTIAAESRAATPAEAQRAGATAMTGVMGALKTAGIPEDAIRTTGYSLNPDTEYVNGRTRVKGYIVRNQAEVRVDDLEKLGKVLDATGSSGATQMAGLRFDVKDRAGLEREALKLAVEEAMARAQAIALGARASLGPVLRIEEQGGGYMPQQMMAMRSDVEAKAMGTPVAPGEIEIRAEVVVSVRVR